VIGTLKLAAIVWMSSDGPPSSSAVLSRSSRWPGIVTQRSRGNDTTKPVCDFGSTCTTIMVSERCPATSVALPNACACCWFWTNARESVPMMRKFAGAALSSCLVSTSSRMCVVRMSLTAFSKRQLPVFTTMTVASTATASAIAKRPTNCLNEEPGATTSGMLLVRARGQPAVLVSPQYLHSSRPRRLLDLLDRQTEVPRDEQPLNLTRPFTDLEDLRVTVEASNG
jgi:hypothetical protein